MALYKFDYLFICLLTVIMYAYLFLPGDAKYKSVVLVHATAILSVGKVNVVNSLARVWQPSSAAVCVWVMAGTTVVGAYSASHVELYAHTSRWKLEMLRQQHPARPHLASAVYQYHVYDDRYF